MKGLLAYEVQRARRKGSRNMINQRVGITFPEDNRKLLITARQAAAMCGKSLRTWRAWDSAGWIPQPVRIGRSTLWRMDELQAWAAAGCPCRQEWQIRSKYLAGLT
jgi:predicted DNA-binding transcriptional regulator AlpA